MHILKLRRWATIKLAAKKISSAALDADILLAHLLKIERTELFLYPRKKITALQEKKYRLLIAQRGKRIPIAYITGTKEFYGSSFFVNSSVLIPRTDTTETLIDEVLAYLKDHPRTHTLLDMGTGSGAIAIALALHTPHPLSITASDSSQRALIVARKNEKNLLKKRIIRWIKSDLFGNIFFQTSPQGILFDVIVANLPYISEKEFTGAKKIFPELAREPRGALVSGKDGMDAIRALLKQAPAHLTEHGAIFLEIGPTQAKKISSLVKIYFGRDWSAAITKDLAGIERFARIHSIQSIPATTSLIFR